MTNEEQKLREFAEKWGWFVKATSIDMTQFELNKDTEQCLSDLTALISEGYVTKEKYMDDLCDEYQRGFEDGKAEANNNDRL